MTVTGAPAGGSGGPQNAFMDQFNLEARTQRVWDINHAIWFTLMGVGGGVFLTGTDPQPHRGPRLPARDTHSRRSQLPGDSRRRGHPRCIDLGRPLQFWRAFVNIRTSWITWGAWSDLIFLAVGGLLVLPALSLGGSEPFSGLGWDPHGRDGTGLALEIIAGVAAVVVMTYAGAVLARPRSIPYWNSPAVPLQFLLSSAAMSVAVVLLIEVIAGEPVSAGQMVLLAVLTAALLVTVVAHLFTQVEAPGKKESLERLLRGCYRWLFCGSVVATGTALPLVLALVGAAASGARDALAVVCCVLLVPGGFWLRLLTLRVGIFPPVHIPSVRGPRTAASTAGG